MSDFLSQFSGLKINVQQSILANVLALLNTRRGSLLHMPEYGVPEYDTRPQFSYAKQQFISSLKELIERYEPRITSLVIYEINSERCDCVLQLKLTATLADLQTFCLAALLLSGGEMLVKNA